MTSIAAPSTLIPVASHPPRFTCKHCSRNFKTRNAVYQHLVHKNLDPSGAVSYIEERPHQTRGQLLKDVSLQGVETKKKAFLCPRCDRVFASELALQAHSRDKLHTLLSDTPSVQTQSSGSPKTTSFPTPPMFNSATRLRPNAVSSKPAALMRNVASHCFECGRSFRTKEGRAPHDSAVHGGVLQSVKHARISITGGNPDWQQPKWLPRQTEPPSSRTSLSPALDSATTSYQVIAPPPRLPKQATPVQSEPHYWSRASESLQESDIQNVEEETSFQQQWGQILLQYLYQNNSTAPPPDKNIDNHFGEGISTEANEQWSVVSKQDETRVLGLLRQNCHSEEALVRNGYRAASFTETELREIQRCVKCDRQLKHPDI